MQVCFEGKLSHLTGSREDDEAYTNSYHTYRDALQGPGFIVLGVR
jgi:hypothetical protein